MLGVRERVWKRDVGVGGGGEGSIKGFERHLLPRKEVL